MHLTKFLSRKCKVCMRILLLKSLLLCTNCPSFLLILCGILLFLPWISFCFYRGYLSVFAVESFLFLSWICFCRGFVFAVDAFVYIPSSFLLFSLVPSIISHEIRKTWEFFGKKSIVFGKKSIVFWGYTLTSNV